MTKQDKCFYEVLSLIICMIGGFLTNISLPIGIWVSLAGSIAYWHFVGLIENNFGK